MFLRNNSLLNSNLYLKQDHYVRYSTAGSLLPHLGFARLHKLVQAGETLIRTNKGDRGGDNCRESFHSAGPLSNRTPEYAN